MGSADGGRMPPIRVLPRTTGGARFGNPSLFGEVLAC